MAVISLRNRTETLAPCAKNKNKNMKNHNKLTSRIMAAGGWMPVVAAMALVVAAVVPVMAANNNPCGPASPNSQVYLPNPAFLQGIDTDETASFGGSGTLNGIKNTEDGVEYNVTFGPGGDVSVSVDATFFGPYLDLWSFTAAEVNTEVLKGSASIQMFLQDGSASYDFQTAAGLAPQSVANGNVLLEDIFSTASYNTGLPLDQSEIIRYGFKFFGSPGTTATIRISSLAISPEPCIIENPVNLLIDSGFEYQTPPASGGWNSFGGLFSSAYAHSGDWSMFDAALDSVPGTYEQFPAAPGSKWDLTGFGLTPGPLLGSPAFGLLQVTFFDVFGNNLGTVETAGTGTPAKTSGEVDGTATPAKWIFLDTGIATAPAGTAYIQAFTLYVDYSGNYQGVYFDDLTLRVLENHWDYVESVEKNAQALVKAGSITQSEAEAMVAAAAYSGCGQ